MTVPAAPSLTWTYLDGDWHEGNVPIMGPRSHAAWLASQCFDGARWFDGVAPDLDLHLARCNRSADGIGLRGYMDVEETLGIDQHDVLDGGNRAKLGMLVEPVEVARGGRQDLQHHGGLVGEAGGEIGRAAVDRHVGHARLVG